MYYGKYNNLIKEILEESFVKDSSRNPIIYYTSSDTEAEQMISTLLAKNPVRGLYDLKNNIYIFGNAFNLIHADLIEKLKLYGKGFTYLPILEKEIYQYLDKYCAMFKIIDENDYKSFSSSDGYKYAYIGKLKNNQYVIFRNNELAPSHYNAPDELNKIQKVPLFKNIQFKKYDIKSIYLKSKDQLPQKTVNESINQPTLNDNFWKWFGNSKMKKKNGEPIVFYHTTEYNFNVFEPIIFKKNKPVINYDKGRSQYYFAKNKKWSQRFGKEELSSRKKIKTLSVFLKVENPIVIRHDVNMTIDEWIQYFATKNIKLNKSILEKTVQYINHYNPKTHEADPGFLGNFWQLCFRDTHYFKDKFNEAGYDGIIFRDTPRGGYPRLSIVVFNANQIKSVDNYGTWNPNSNNIMESFDYIEDVKVLLNPTKHEFNHFIQHNKWYHVLLSKSGFVIWSAETPLLHYDVEKEYGINKALHLFAFNGNIYFEDCNLNPKDFTEKDKKWYINLAQKLNKSKILQTYFPNLSIKQNTIDMFNGKKILSEEYDSIHQINENKFAEAQEDIKYILSSDTILFNCDTSLYDFILTCYKQGQKPESFYFNFYRNRIKFINACRSLLSKFQNKHIIDNNKQIKKKISLYKNYSISKQAIMIILNSYYGHSLTSI